MYNWQFSGFDSGNMKQFSYKIKASTKQEAIQKGFEKLRKNGGSSTNWTCKLIRN